MRIALTVGFMRMRIAQLVLSLTLRLTLAPSVMSAQATRASTPAADSLLNRALASAATGDTSAALELLEKANRLAKKDPEVLYWRGFMLSRSTDLGMRDVPRNALAWLLLERAAELDPKNPRYLMEMGRIRLNTPMLRLDAERMFGKALRLAEEHGRPEQVADITWELAQIKERRYATTKDRYLLSDNAHFFKANEAIHQKHYTREFLEQHAQPMRDIGATDRSESEELYRRGLRAAPTHEPNAVGVLGLLYDQGRFQEMREVVRPFLAADAGSARLRFAAGLAAYRTGAPADAEKLFDEALARLTEAERRDAGSLSRIVRRRDAESYAALSPADRARTDSAYWEAADPLLSTPANEGRLEFLARVAIADLRYTSDDTRQTGWKTDRGLILVRYGEPPIVAVFPPQLSNAAGEAADAVDATGRVLTVWFWPREERTYVFAGPPAMNYASFAGNMRGYAEENRENAPFLLDNVPFAVAIDTIPLQVARFRGSKTGTSQVIIAADVNVQRLYDNVEIDRSTLALSLRAGAPSRLRVAAADTVAVTLPFRGASSRVWRQEAAPGQFRVRVEAQDVAVSGASARAQADLEILAPRAAFEVSDLLIAKRVNNPDVMLTGLSDTRLEPRGSVTLAQRELFSVYWELYGVRANPDGRMVTDVKAEVTLLEIDRSKDPKVARVLGAIADAVGLTKEGEQQLGVRYQRTEPLGDRDRIPFVTTLSLGTSPPGTYRLQIIVTDRTTGATLRTDRIFHVAHN